LAAAIAAAAAAFWRWCSVTQEVPSHAPKRTPARPQHAQRPASWLSIRLPTDLRRRLDCMAADIDEAHRRAGLVKRWEPRFTTSHLVRELLAAAVAAHESRPYQLP